jgi:hypothetical protein
VAVKNRGGVNWWVHYESGGPARLAAEAEKQAGLKGFRPSAVTVRPLRGGVEFAVIFNDDERATELRPALAAGDFPEIVRGLRDNDQRIRSLAPYTLGGKSLLAAVVGPAESVAWDAQIDLTEDAYAAALKKARKDGQRPVSVAVSGGPAPRFALVTAADRPGAEWEVRRGLSAGGLRDEAAALAARGYWPALVFGYAEGEQSRYLAVFEREKGKP